MRKLLLAIFLTIPVSGAASIKMANGIVCISSSATDLTANWTVATWLQFTVQPVSLPTVFYARATTFPTAQLGLGTHNSTFEVWSDNTFLTIAEVPVIGNKWYSVLVTRSGDVWTLYLDGVLAKQVTQALTQGIGQEFCLGGGPDGSLLAQGGAFTMAEVAGWNSVLSSNLITALAHGTRISEFPIKPVYYWPLYSAGPGTNGFRIPDMSGNGWHGAVELLFGPGNPLESDNPGDCPCGTIYHH